MRGLGQVKMVGSGVNAWVRLEWKYQVKIARSRSARRANVKLAWRQYEVRMAGSNGKGMSSQKS